jgi:hypothetical protein
LSRPAPDRQSGARVVEKLVEQQVQHLVEQDLRMP